MTNVQTKETPKFGLKQILEMTIVGSVILLLTIFLPTWIQGETSEIPDGYPTVAPEPPRNLKAESGSGNIELTWDPSRSWGLRGYYIYRGMEGNGIGEFLAYPYNDSVEPTLLRGDRFVDRNVNSDAKYQYFMVSENISKLLSDPSHFAIYLDDETPPELPCIPYDPGVETDLPICGDDDMPPEDVEPFEPGKIRLFIPESKATNGSVITIPISIGNADDLTINNSRLVITYNQAVLKAIDMKPRQLLENKYDVMTNLTNADDGKIAAIFVDTGGNELPRLYGESKLFDIKFEVIGTPPDTSLIHIVPVGQEVEFSVPDTTGTVMLDTVVYTDAVASAIGIDAALELDLQDGLFTVEPDISYVYGDVAPAANGDFKVLRDGDPFAEIDPNDYSMSMNIAVAMVSTNNRQKIVGDPNQDERLDSADSVYIRRIADGEEPLLNAEEQTFADGLDGTPITPTLTSPQFEPGDTVVIDVFFDNLENFMDEGGIGSFLAGVDMTIAYPCDNFEGDLTVTATYTEANLEIVTHIETIGDGTCLLHISMIDAAAITTARAQRAMKRMDAGLAGGGFMRIVREMKLNNDTQPWTMKITGKTKDTVKGGIPMSVTDARLSDRVGQDIDSSNVQADVDTKNAYLQAGAEYTIYLPIVLK